MLNPAVVVIAVGFVAAGTSWGDSIGGVEVGGTDGEGWQAVITGITSPSIIMGIIMVKPLVIIGYPF
jgi:hypothetical protein